MKPDLKSLFDQLQRAEKYLHECQCKVHRFRSRFVPANEWHDPKAKVRCDPSDKPRLVHPTDLARIVELTEARDDAKKARDVTQTLLLREFSKLPLEAIKRHAESPHALPRRAAKHCLRQTEVTVHLPIHVLEALEQTGLDPAEIGKRAIEKAYLDSDPNTKHTDPK